MSAIKVKLIQGYVKEAFEKDVNSFITKNVFRLEDIKFQEDLKGFTALIIYEPKYKVKRREENELGSKVI